MVARVGMQLLTEPREVVQGGSVILDANTYSGSVTIQAIGGKGGDENDLGTTQRCYGAGGGGSGGAIYFTGSIPAVPVFIYRWHCRS